MKKKKESELQPAGKNAELDTEKEVFEIAGNLLKKLREAKGLTIKQLAEQSGVSEQLITKVEACEPTDDYRVSETYLLSLPLGVHYSELFPSYTHFLFKEIEE